LLPPPATLLPPPQESTQTESETSRSTQPKDLFMQIELIPISERAALWGSGFRVEPVSNLASNFTREARNVLSACTGTLVHTHSG
jgi:hypothetical protein